MKCPSCGAEIGDSKFCEYCGSQITPEMKKEQEILNKTGCPKCGSTNLQIKRERQGEIVGKKGRKIVNQTVAICNDCGYSWFPNGKEKPRKTWLWVLGWIFIFPLPLTLIIIKKKEMKPALKYGIIAAAWILFVILGIWVNSSDGDQVSNSSTIPNAGVVQSVETTTQNGQNVNDTTTKSSTSTEEQTTAATAQAEAAPKVDVLLSADEAGEYGKIRTLNEGTDLSYTVVLFYLPAGTYTVSSNDTKGVNQVSVLSGIEFDGQWEQFLSDDCANPIVLQPNSAPQKLEVKEGQFVKLSDGAKNIHFVLDN